MDRTIPSFRIVTVWEEEKWKLYRKYLRNKNEKRLFTNMFLIGTLYNSAFSNAVNPYSNISYLDVNHLPHYKTILSKSVIGFDNNSSSSDGDSDSDINDHNNNSTTILKQELDKWYNFSFVLRKQNRELFVRMIQLSYKYSNAINAKGEQFSTVSLIMSLLFEQY